MAMEGKGGGVHTASRKGQTSHTPHTHTQPEWGQEKFPRKLFPILTVRATYIMEENRRGGYITSSQLRLLSHEGYITTFSTPFAPWVIHYILSATPSVPWGIHYNLLNTFCTMSDILHPLSYAFCPMRDTLHPLSYAFCPMRDTLHPLSYAFCPMSDILHPLSYAFCPMRDTLHPLSYAFCPMRDTFRGGHRHLQIGRMHDIDLISEPPTPTPPRYMDPKCGNLCGQWGKKGFIASWDLRMSHICPCTPCPSPQG